MKVQLTITFEADETFEIPPELEDAFDAYLPYWDYDLIFTDGGEYEGEEELYG